MLSSGLSAEAFCLHRAQPPQKPSEHISNDESWRYVTDGKGNCLTVTFALPMSPFVENLMPSFVTEIMTVSPMPLRSLHDAALDQEYLR